MEPNKQQLETLRKIVIQQRIQDLEGIKAEITKFASNTIKSIDGNISVLKRKFGKTSCEH